MRILKIALALSVALSALLVAAPSSAHIKAATVKASIEGTTVDGGTMTFDVKIRVTNKSSRKRDIGCEYNVRRSDNDDVVAGGFDGKVIPGNARRTIRTTAQASDPGTTEFYVEILHCHTFT